MDVEADPVATITLARRITTLPTLVLIDTAGREVARLNGHPGEPAPLYRFLDKHLARIQE
jgi:hypothetical protein